jgi:hypothetical protein
MSANRGIVVGMVIVVFAAGAAATPSGVGVADDEVTAHVVVPAQDGAALPVDGGLPSAIEDVILPEGPAQGAPPASGAPVSPPGADARSIDGLSTESPAKQPKDIGRQLVRVPSVIALIVEKVEAALLAPFVALADSVEFVTESPSQMAAALRFTA